MSDAWRQIDLAGGGLQAANVRLAKLLRRRGVALVLLALFPLGLHRDYLHDHRGAWLYRAATLAAALAVLFGLPEIAGLALIGCAGFAIYDFVRLGDLIARVNKKLRMEVYLSQSAGAPPGFKGRYTDEPQPDAGSAGEERVSSFAEQERQLRELAARRRSGE